MPVVVGDRHLTSGSGPFDNVGARLAATFAAAATNRGLVALPNAIMFAPGTVEGHRCAVVVTWPAHVSERGVDGRAAVVVDVIGVGSRRAGRLRFLDRLDVNEVVLVDPDRRVVDVFVRRADRLVPRRRPLGRWFDVRCLGAQVTQTVSPALRVRWNSL